MTQKVSMPGKKQDMVTSMIPMATGMIGTAVGEYYGGPAGGAVGGKIGGEIGNSAVGSDVAPVSAVDNPAKSSQTTDALGAAERRKQDFENMNQMQSGLEAAKQDPEAYKQYGSYLEDGLKKAKAKYDTTA